MNMLFHKEYPCYLAIYTAAKNNKIMVLGIYQVPTRCDSIMGKRIRFLMNLLIRIVCVHFTIHFFQITASFS